IMTCKNAHEMWLKLESIFERDSEQQKCSLMQQFFEFKRKKESDMATHIINDTMIISKLLNTLPESCKFFASARESTPARERTLTNLTARLLAEEARNATSEEEIALKMEEKVY
ncbi:hypothetical protein X777_15266, partial [Ooceraea biroi]